MNYKKKKDFLVLLILLLIVTGLNGCAFSGYGNSSSWQEEVLLHDGRKIIVERSLTHGGRGEIGQSPIKEQSLSFTLPGSGKSITWKDDYSEDVGRASFLVLALHLMDDTPYLVVTPHLCLAYNKWGRPNPPYVFFKYDGTAWQRVSLAEFPAEFTEINIVYNTIANEKKLEKQGVASVEMIVKFNNNAKRPEFKTILREPKPPGSEGVSCEVMIRNERNNGWRGFDISSIRSYAECLEKCRINKISEQFCPCNNLLQTKPEWR